MPTVKRYTANRNLPCVRHALSPTETFDWRAEQDEFEDAIDLDLQGAHDAAGAAAADASQASSDASDALDTANQAQTDATAASAEVAELAGKIALESGIDVIMYVSMTGNDSTGDGSIGSPYASIGKCLELIPYVIPDGTSVIIRVANGGYSNFPATIDKDIQGTGQLIIESYEAWTQESPAGPFDIDSITAHAVVAGYTITSTGENFSGDNLHAFFLEVVTGAKAGQRYSVHSHDTDTVTIIGVDPPGVGDTYRFVRPGVTFPQPSSLEIAVKTSGKYCNFIMSGLFFTVYGADLVDGTVQINGNSNVGLFGVIFDTSQQSSLPLSVANMSLNGAPVADYTKVDYLNSVVSSSPPWADDAYMHLAGCFKAIRSSLYAATTVLVREGGTGTGTGSGHPKIQGLCTRGAVENQSTYLELLYSGFGRFKQTDQHGASASVNTCISHASFGGSQFEIKNNSSLFVNAVHDSYDGQLATTYDVDEMSKIEGLDNLTAEANDAYAVSLGFGCKALLSATPGISSADGHIYFKRGQVAHGWPEAGLSISDTENAFAAMAGTGSVNPGMRGVRTHFGYSKAEAFAWGETQTTSTSPDSTVLTFEDGASPIITDEVEVPTPAVPGRLLVFDVVIMAAVEHGSFTHIEAVWAGKVFGTGSPQLTDFDTTQLTRQYADNSGGSYEDTVFVTKPAFAWNAGKLEITCEATGIGAVTVAHIWQAHITADCMDGIEPVC